MALRMPYASRSVRREPATYEDSRPISLMSLMSQACFLGDHPARARGGRKSFNGVLHVLAHRLWQTQKWAVTSFAVFPVVSVGGQRLEWLGLQVIQLREEMLAALPVFKVELAVARGVLALDEPTSGALPILCGDSLLDVLQSLSN